MSEETQSFDQLLSAVRELCSNLEQVRLLDRELFDSSPEAELLRGIKAALAAYDAHGFTKD